MINSKALDKRSDTYGPYISAGCVVQLKEYEFFFRREPVDFTPHPDFVPFFWRRKGDDLDGEGSGKEKGLDSSMGPTGVAGSQVTNMEVDTNQLARSSNHGKSVAPAGPLQAAMVTGLPGSQTTMVITLYNPNPQTPRGIEIVSRIRRVSPSLLRSVPPAPAALEGHLREASQLDLQAVTLVTEPASTAGPDPRAEVGDVAPTGSFSTTSAGPAGSPAGEATPAHLHGSPSRPVMAWSHVRWEPQE